MPENLPCVSLPKGRAAKVPTEGRVWSAVGVGGSQEGRLEGTPHLPFESLPQFQK